MSRGHGTSAALRDFAAMKHIQSLKQSSGLATVLIVAGLALAACNKAEPPAAVQQAPAPTAALALTDASAPPLADAPPVSALPPAPPARVAHLQSRQATAMPSPIVATA